MKYHKIQTILKRDPETKFKTLLRDEFSIPEFEYLQHCLWTATEKVDGTNIRVIWDGETVRFGGRTDNAQIPAALVEALIAMFPKKLCALIFTGPIVLFGEGYGAKIQKGGGLYRSDQSFVMFDACAGDTWFTRDSLQELALQLGIKIVPDLGDYTLFGALEWAREGGEVSMIGQSTDCRMEGLVLRPTVELKDRLGKRIVTKIKVKDFQ